MNVFICGLTCMQYKFYVDGKWGYDESKHHVTGDYGIVNTLHLSTDDMTIDNDAFLACGESDIPYA